MRFGPIAALLPLLAMAALATGCRALARKAAEEPPDEAAKNAGAGSGSGTDEGEGEDSEDAAESGAAKNAHDSGPKIMGYEFFARYSLGLIRGRYSDVERNDAQGTSRNQSGVVVNGKRYAIESYPALTSGSTSNHHAYVLLELRRETPAPAWWTQRTSAIVALGYVLPKFRLIVPVVGLHMEFNRVALDEPDSPEVAKSDIRAYIVGVRARQKIWGTGEWFGAYFDAIFHMLNWTLPNNGFEAEAGLGTAFQWQLLRADLGASYQYQQYFGHREADEGSRAHVSVKSKNRATILTGTLWL